MLEKIKIFLQGHVIVGPVTIYGFNAMHLCLVIETRWGRLSFHPGWGEWPWTLTLSPNATPWASTFARGPGLDQEQILLAPVRRALFGHGYDTDLLESFLPYVAIKDEAEKAGWNHDRTRFGGLMKRAARPDELAMVP